VSIFLGCELFTNVCDFTAQRTWRHHFVRHAVSSGLRCILHLTRFLVSGTTIHGFLATVAKTPIGIFATEARNSRLEVIAIVAELPEDLHVMRITSSLIFTAPQ